MSKLQIHGGGGGRISRAIAEKFLTALAERKAAEGPFPSGLRTIF